MLFPVLLTLSFTAYHTLLLVNVAIKYYDQMEVMPIYQTNIMIWSIIVGMASLDEIRYYSNDHLSWIFFSIVLCISGAIFLFKK